MAYEINWSFDALMRDHSQLPENRPTEKPKGEWIHHRATTCGKDDQIFLDNSEIATAFGSSITKHARPSDDASAFWHVVFVRVGRGSKASASPALVENAMRTTVAAVSNPASRLTAFDVGHDANVGSPCNGNWPGDYQFLLHSSAVSAMRLVKRSARWSN
ncbi:hypothetical protein CPB85DRAFT_1260417 [Mucidula mucida]|nr:hypothetical protein CPB85DRAFT_1260417 [Mucidula mucida]